MTHAVIVIMGNSIMLLVLFPRSPQDANRIYTVIAITTRHAEYIIMFCMPVCKRNHCVTAIASSRIARWWVRPQSQSLPLPKTFIGGLVYVGFLKPWLSIKVTKNGKDQESIQSRSTPDPGHHMGK